MYEATHNEDIYLTILDEMNIARVEYYFAEMLSRDHVKELSRFKIEDRKLRTAQQTAADSLAGFLYSIDDLNERAKAAANLVIRLKDIINDSIEEAVMQSADDNYQDDIEDAEFEVEY